MQTTKELQLTDNQIPEFISKVYSMVQKSQLKNIISWSEDGEQIVIKNIKKFENEVLPHYFRHSRLKSFIRQLNMYCFRKSKQIFKNTKQLYFKHQLFRRENYKQFNQIKRKRKAEPSEEQVRSVQNSIYNRNQQLERKIIQLNELLINLRSNHPEIQEEMQQIFQLTDDLLKKSEIPQQKQTILDLNALNQEIPQIEFISFNSLGEFDV